VQGESSPLWPQSQATLIHFYFHQYGKCIINVLLRYHHRYLVGRRDHFEHIDAIPGDHFEKIVVVFVASVTFIFIGGFIWRDSRLAF